VIAEFVENGSMLDEDQWSVAWDLMFKHFGVPLNDVGMSSIVAGDTVRGTMVPVGLMLVGPVCHATILLRHRWHSRTEFGKVPGCCLPTDEEHSRG